MASQSEDTKPPMALDPNAEREAIVRAIANGLIGHGGRTVLQSFNCPDGLVKISVYPDETRQDAPLSFTVKVTHDLT